MHLQSAAPFLHPATTTPAAAAAAATTTSSSSSSSSGNSNDGASAGGSGATSSNDTLRGGGAQDKGKGRGKGKEKEKGKSGYLPMKKGRAVFRLLMKAFGEDWSASLSDELVASIARQVRARYFITRPLKIKPKTDLPSNTNLPPT